MISAISAHGRASELIMIAFAAAVPPWLPNLGGLGRVRAGSGAGAALSCGAHVSNAARQQR
eukprot:1528435-Rhodomonas_salina.2